MWDDSWDVEFDVYVREVGQAWVFMKNYWLPGTSPETWYADTIDISGFDGKVIEIAWDYLSNNEWALYIDDVLVTANPGGGPGPGPGGAECAAIGVFEHGYLEQTLVIDNRVEEIHSAGHSYGVDYAPENFAPATFQPATDWVQYCDDYTENGLGLTAGGTVTEAIQLTDTELAAYRGMDICELVVSIGCDAYGGDSGIPYEVWISETQPTDPTTATVYATGTSDSSIWNTIDIDDYTIPASGDVWLGVLMTHPSGVYPMGFDTTNTITRGGYLWYSGGGWTDLGSVGYPGVWGIKVGICAGGGGGGTSAITVNCNYFRGIGDNSTYDVWANALNAPYPGVMFKVEEPNVPGAGNASAVTLKCNYFDNECINTTYAVENADTENILDATLNYWGQVDGPDSDPIRGPVQDPVTGQIADQRGANIVLNGPVMFDPWLGVHAEIVKPMGAMVSVEVGEPLTFDASCPDGSFGYCFPTCDECCEPEYQELQYLWDFDDGMYSSHKVDIHVFDQPGIYHVSLMVDTFGFPYHSNFMYDWAYVTVEVVPAGTPFTANADGEGLGEYETSIDEPVTLYGSATGGVEPYFYSWDFGDGTSTPTSSRDPTVTHKYAEPGTYTVTLTVTDMSGDRVTDTSTVLVYDVEELFVSISGQSSIAEGDSITFTSTVSGGSSPYTYSWNFGDGITSNLAKPTHIYENSGIYTVSLTVTDNMGAEKTKTKTVTVSSADTSEVEISNVKGGLLLKATIVSDSVVSWSIDVQGKVFFGGAADGTAQGVTQVKLPFTLAFGNVDIAITAGTEVKEYTAFAFGPLFFGLQEA
jgi:PKD repeat protein